MGLILRVLTGVSQCGVFLAKTLKTDVRFGTLFLEDLWTVQAVNSLRRPREHYL